MSSRLTAIAGALAAGMLAIASPAAAAGPSLRTAFESAWQRAVVAREVASQRQRAQAEQATAASWAAGSPALELGHREDRGGGRESELALAWPLWLPSQRAAAGAAAQAGDSLAAAAEQVARLQVAGEVRETYWALRARQAELQAAQARALSLQRLADDVDLRVRAGDLAPTDALAARAEHLAAAAQQAQAGEQLAAARLRWLALTGREPVPEPPAAAAAAAPEAHPQRIADAEPLARAGSTSAAAPEAHPQRIAAQRAVAAAQARLALAAASRREAPEIVLGVRQDVPVEGIARDSVALRLRLPLATRGRNAPLLAAAQTELEVAQASERAWRERLAAELTIAREALAAAGRLHEIETKRAALLASRAELIDRAWRAGHTPLPEALRAIAAAAEAEVAVTRQRAGLGLARARLEQALGVLP